MNNLYFNQYNTITKNTQTDDLLLEICFKEEYNWRKKKKKRHLYSYISEQPVTRSYSTFSPSERPRPLLRVLPWPAVATVPPPVPVLPFGFLPICTTQEVISSF